MRNTGNIALENSVSAHTYPRNSTSRWSGLVARNTGIPRLVLNPGRRPWVGTSETIGMLEESVLCHA